MTWDTGAPWLGMAVLVLAIEALAILTHRRTLSQQVWAATARQPWRWLLPVLVAVGMVMLWAHFFMGLWR